MAELFDPNVSLPVTQQALMTGGPDDALTNQRLALAERKARLKAWMAKNAPAPEGQMVSGHYVAPSWTQYLPGLADKFQQGAEQQQIDNDTIAQGVREKADLRDTLQALSGTSGQSATPFGSRDAPQQDAIPATPAPTGADRRALIARLIDNPAAGTIGGELLKDDLISAPIRQETRQAKQEEAQAAREERGAQLAADRELRAEQARQRSEDLRLTLAQRQQAAQEHNDLMRELAAGRRADAAAARANKPEKVVNLTSAQQKAYDEADALIGQIDTTLAAVKANPDALGKKTIIPDIALATFDPKGVQTRAAVAGLAAEKVHALSGAAVSPAEFARLRPYMPASGDSAQAVQDKLTNLKSELERIRSVHARGPTAATGGAPVKVSTQADVDRLPRGTTFTGPDGKTYRKD